MPVYHFDINGGTNESDRPAVDLRDLAEAKSDALKLAGKLIADASETFWDNPEWMLIVTDEEGQTLFQLQVLGAEGPADTNLSRVGFGEGTFDQAKKADRADIGVDGS